VLGASSNLEEIAPAFKRGGGESAAICDVLRQLDITSTLVQRMSTEGLADDEH
jgi:hypothetical protein